MTLLSIVWDWGLHLPGFLAFWNANDQFLQLQRCYSRQLPKYSIDRQVYGHLIPCINLIPVDNLIQDFSIDWFIFGPHKLYMGDSIRYKKNVNKILCLLYWKPANLQLEIEPPYCLLQEITSHQRSSFSKGTNMAFPNSNHNSIPMQWE